MKFSYRITKYHSYFDTNNKILSSQPREWTSFCDVENGMVSLEEYEKIESEYIRIILEICKFVDIRYLTIKELENFNHLKEYKNNQRIYIENNLTELLKLILREKYHASYGIEIVNSTSAMIITYTVYVIKI